MVALRRDVDTRTETELRLELLLDLALRHLDMFRRRVLRGEPSKARGNARMGLLLLAERADLFASRAVRR